MSEGPPRPSAGSPEVRGPTEELRTQSSSAGPLAVQNGLPVVGPRAQPAAGGLQLHMLVVAGREQDVLPAGVWLSPCDVWPVVYEKVGGYHSLVSGQHNLLQKIRAKVLLHPGILNNAREKNAPSDLSTDHKLGHSQDSQERRAPRGRRDYPAGSRETVLRETA